MRERERAQIPHARNRLFELFAAPDFGCRSEAADLKYALMAERFTAAGDIEGPLLPMRLLDPLLKMAYFLSKAASLIMAFSCRHAKSSSIHA